MALKCDISTVVKDFQKEGSGWLLFGLQEAEYDTLLPIYNAYSDNLAITSITAIKLGINKNVISRTALATDLIIFSGDQYITDTTKLVSLNRGIHQIEFANGFNIYRSEPFLVYNKAAFTFDSIQPGALNQVSITYNLDVGKIVHINWGEGEDILLTADGADQAIISTYSSINTTYNIVFSGDIEFIRKFQIVSETTISNLNFDNMSVKFSGLTFLYLQSLGTGFTGSIDNLPTALTVLILSSLGTSLTGSINNLPTGLTFLLLRTIGTTFTGSIDNLPTALTTLHLNNLGTNFTGSIDNLPTALTAVTLSSLGTAFTGSIANLPTTLRTIFFNSLGTTINITAGVFPAWAATTITITSSYLTASVDGFFNTWVATAGAGVKTIDLDLSNQARSAASDAAVLTLQGLGKTIITT